MVEKCQNMTRSRGKYKIFYGYIVISAAFVILTVTWGTNRTFGVRVQLIADLFQTEPVALRVVLVSGGEEVGQTGMTLNAEFDRATGILRVEPGTEANVGLMLTRDDCKTVRVVVQDPVTDAVLDQSEELPVKLGI